MIKFYFSKRSKKILATADIKLQKIFKEAIKNAPYDFMIVEGKRTFKRQEEFFKQGLSKTLKSKHLWGKAVDIAILKNSKLTWEFSYYKELAIHIKKISEKMGIKIQWGGDWSNFLDGVHFELKE